MVKIVMEIEFGIMGQSEGNMCMWKPSFLKFNTAEPSVQINKATIFQNLSTVDSGGHGLPS